MRRRHGAGRQWLVSLLVAALVAGVLPAAKPTPVKAADPAGLGGQLFSTGQSVEVEVLPASAGFTSELWLFEPGPERRLATNRDVGTVVQLGIFPAGVELVFGIKVLNTGNTFKMGPGSRNPDGIPHAVVTFLDNGRARVGFEDLFGGGDRDYNDNIFEFRGGIQPEPPRGPTANAGPDQTVDEGALVTLDGTASTDPDSQNLTYAWALGSQTGPPIVLSSSTSATPAFQTTDDGTYRFTLTVSDGTSTDTDEVSVTVRNKNPVLTAQADPAYAGGVALVTTSFTDLGIIDTHHGTFDWGDGTAPQEVAVSAQGSGWGSLIGSHVYATAGSYTVRVTVTDDDGGSATATVAGLEVLVPVALWANSSSADAAMESTSGKVTVEGLTHTNDDLRLRGDLKTFIGPTEYARTLDVGGAGATFDPPPVKTAIKPFPFRYDIAAYRPTGSAAIQAGPAYHDMSAQCGTTGAWHVNGATLTSGIYYATCGIQINGNPVGGTITVAAEGDIAVSGTTSFFDPFTDGLLFISNSTSANAIRVDNSTSSFLGYSFAERGRIVINGAGNHFYCGILGDRIDIAARDLFIHGSGCGRPAHTNAPPTIVPSLTLDVAVDKADALPAQPLRHTATVTNAGATLVVPGIVGLQNLGSTEVTVTGHDLHLEYLAASDGAWHPLPGIVSIDVRPNAFAGVIYPTGAERIDGTRIAGGALASWGYAAVDQLTPAQTALMLDPDRTLAIRAISTFEVSPATTPVRRLFRFGDDMAGQIRSMGATATDVRVTIIPPAGDARTFLAPGTATLASLAPGASADVQLDSVVPAPAARAADESDAAYLARLHAFDGTPLFGTAFARGTAPIGPILAPADVATTTRHLPIVAVDKTGPADAEAGTTAVYSIGLHNHGSAEARSIAVTDAITGVGSLTVTGAPATLAAGASGSAAASYAIPAAAPSQTLDNVATARWADAAGGTYGPLNDHAATRVITPRKLAVAKTGLLTTAADGTQTIHYEIAVTNLGDQQVTNVTVADTPDGLTSIVPGSVTTTAGTVTAGNESDATVIGVAIGTLAGRSTQVVMFNVTVGTVPEGVVSVTNQATVSSTELPQIVSDDPEAPGAADPTVNPVGPTSGGGGGGGGEARPTIGTPTPADGTVLTEPTTISVEITPPDGQSVASWKITATRAGTTGETTLATGVGGAVDEAVTASAPFDPTKLPNGTYLITVRSTASGGGIHTSITSLIVDGALKLGRYVTSYLDLSVGVGGLPMRVVRTYDSFDKAVGDFGVGWRVELANFRVSTNGPLGRGGWVQEAGTCGLIFCTLRYSSTQPHFVTVVWPDSHQEIFDLAPLDGSTFFRPLTAAAFKARPGSTSTLEALDTSLWYPGDGNLYGGGFGTGGIYDPQQFRLTSTDGTVYILDRRAGLVSATDRAGNTLTVSSTGITSSLGLSITFTRDAQGRITKITGPANEQLTYAYSAAGNLASFTDQVGQTVSYTYDADHNLLVTKDPLNRPFRTLQYTDGRLTAVIDALGNVTTVDSDVGDRQEVVTDAAGRLTTISTFDAHGNLVRRDAVSDGQTRTTTFTYDAKDNVTSRTDPLGHTWRATWDDQRNLTSFRDPTGATVSLTYDRGLAKTWTDPAGKVTRYDYDAAGNLTSITDSLGKAETYTYDGAGNRLTRTDRTSHTWTYTYDAQGHQTKRTDPLGKATSYTYDAAGRLATETDPLGKITRYAYDALGRTTSVTDPLGNVTSWTYDVFGDVATNTLPGGFTTTWLRNAAAQVTKETDATGAERLFAYDPNGRLARLTDAEGGVTTYAYDGAGLLATMTDPVGRPTGYTYDDAGFLATTTNAAGGVTRYGYDAAGRLMTTTDPAGKVTTRTYDARGLLASVRDPLGRLTQIARDDVGRETRLTDPAGNPAGTSYDDAGRVLTRSNAAGETTSLGYDAAGRLTSTTDPLGHVTGFGYDDAGRQTSITDPLGNQTTLSYDDAGRLIRQTSAEGIATTYGYDPRGLQTEVRDALGNRLVMTYDRAGRLATETDPRGATTTYSYDRAGRLTAIRDQLGGTVRFGYDAAGQRTSLTDARGKSWSQTFDLLGGVKTATDPLGRVESMTYDTRGLVKTRTDELGLSFTYGYDDAGQLKTLTGPTETVSYGYDAIGRKTSATSAGGSIQTTFDEVGRITGQTTPQASVGYVYDDAGRRTSMTSPVGAVAYGYDNADRLTSLTPPGSGAITFGYNRDGRLASINRPNGLVTTQSYDAAGRLTAIAHKRGGTVVDSFTYGLDADGNRTSVTSPAGTESYTLDALNRLTRVVYPGGRTVSYAYDAAGNRSSMTDGPTTTTYAYDDAGRLTSAGGIALTYDAKGQRLSVGGDTFSWDWAGRLTSANVGGTTSTFTYAADGLRASASSGGSTSSFVWDRAAAVPTLVSDGGSGYVHAGAMPVARLAGGETSYPLTDALGSVRDQTDAAGAVTASASYEVFGSTRLSSGTLGALGFTGASSGPQGLLYFQARYLDPTNGVFLSSDPVRPGAAGVVGFNLYTYAGNNPTTFVDPTGRQTAIEWASIWKYVAVAALLCVATAPCLRALSNAIVLMVQLVDDTLEKLWERPTIPDELRNPPRPEPPGKPDPEPKPKPGGPVDPVPPLPPGDRGCEDQGPGSIAYFPLRQEGGESFATGVNATIVFAMIGTGTPASQSITPPGFVSGVGLARGHLLGAQLGGSGSDERNIVTLYQSMNNSPMKRLENQVRRAVEGCQTVNYTVIPNYLGTGSLPVTSVSINAFGDKGFTLAETVLNEP
jgi:RHS repeat-associated protein/uncharacterized repeat protein (TIGR01451 family)